MSNEDLFDRLKRDAAPLRYEPDDVTLSRIRSRIREQIATPTVTQLLAAWFRPIALTMGTVAVAGAIGIATIDSPGEPSFGENAVEISMAGDTYRVGP